MALNPNIPLSGNPQPSFAQQAGQVYQLKAAFDQQQELQQQRKDQQYIQQALKEGANFDTPQGIAAFAEQAKGVVSPNTYQFLIKAQQEAKMRDAQTQEHLAKADEATLNAYKQKFDFMASNVEEPLFAYDQAKQAGKSEEEALLAFENAKAQKVQQLENMPQVGGQAMMPPEAIQQYQAGNPAQFKAKFEGVKHHQDTLAAAANLRRVEQNIKLSEQQEKTSKAREESLLKGGVGDEMWTEMSPEKQDLAKTIATNALVTGRSPPARGGAYKLGMMGMKALADEFKVTLPELMSAGADVKSQLQAKPVVEKRMQALERAENQLELEIPVMEDAMNKLTLPSIPIAARGKIAVLREMGNPEVSRLDQAADVVFNEFETVKTGNPGALYVANLEAAKENYRKVQTPQQMAAWIKGARRIIHNAKLANQKTREDINKNILRSLHMQPKGKTKSAESTEVPRETEDVMSILKRVGVK